MSYTKYLSLVVTALLLSCFGVLAAPTVRFGPAPSWLVPITPNSIHQSLRDVNDGWYVQFVDQQTNVDRQENYHCLVRDILSDAGVQGASNITVDFNPSYQQLTFHKIVVWRNGQQLDRMKKDGFKVVANEQDLSRFMYHGSYTAYLILEDIRAGDKVEYSYTVIGSNPVFNKKYFSDLVMQSTEPVSHIHYMILAPATRILNMKYINNATKPVVTNEGNMVRYDWNLEDVKGKQYNTGVPSWFFIMPYVQISEYQNWNEVANWAYGINKPVDKLEGALGKRIARMKEESGGDSEKLFRQLVNIAQNEIRYMGVEIGVYSHQANRPEKVYEQRYGDCKDKSLLLVSMLRTAGFTAWVALVNTDAKRELDTWLPCSNDFNHAIVQAWFDGKEVWIDPTIANQGGTGIDIYIPDYGRALVLAPGTTTLTTLPQMTNGNVEYKEMYDVPDEKSPVSLSVYTTYTGFSADDTRHTYANQSRTDLEKNFLDYYSKIYQHMERADSLVINDDREKNSLETIEHYTINDFFEPDSATGGYSASFYAAMIRDMLPQPGNNRTQPLALGFPYNLTYIVKVHSRTKWNIQHSEDLIKRNAYSFSQDVSVVNDELTITYKFHILRDHIPLDETAQYESDRKKIVNDYLSYTYTYTPAGAAAAKTSINWLAICVALLLLGGMAYGCNRLYHKPTQRQMFTRSEPLPLGGWLILPILGMIVTTIRLPYSMITTGYFQNTIWQAYDGTKSAGALKFVLWVELVGNTASIVFAIFCLVLMYHKRDILPKYIKLFYVCSFALVFLDSVFASSLLHDKTAFDSREIMRSLLAVAIWVPYFSRADRVRDTFIVPYPANQGYNNPYAPPPELQQDDIAISQVDTAPPQDDHDRWKPH